MKRESMKLIVLVVIALLVYGSFSGDIDLFDRTNLDTNDNAVLLDAFSDQDSDVWTSGSGVVVKLLRDDLQGSRHQRFIVDIGSGMTVLISHNIDLAPRIDSLREGDSVQFHGEYEWNSKGGVVHWTHHDPGGRNRGGWIKHQGITYQ